MKISLCMIVKDEEEVLARCLDSVGRLADEIVIADTGSTDATKEIARRYTPFVYEFRWTDDFSAARNFVFSKGTGDYLLWLDADDAIPEEERVKADELRAFLARERPDAVFCPYDTAFSGGKPAFTFYRERFLRRGANFRWCGRVHECIATSGKIVRFPLRIAHLGSEKPRGTRNLDLYRKWAKEEELSPRDLFYYGRELYYHGLYREAAAVLEAMLKAGGWYVNRIEACKVLSDCRFALGEREGALRALLESFLYGEPRASVCCKLGGLLRAEGRFREAVFWYEAATACRDHAEEGDFETPTSRTLTPLLELVYCYFRLGEREKSLLCHKKTEELAPEHPSVRYNRAFFGE